MIKYDIPLKNVVRHYEANRKISPGTMAANNWLGWAKFKIALDSNSWNKGLKPETITVDLPAAVL